jgi:hypothetical protein
MTAILLPLVTDVPSASDLSHNPDAPTLQVQMDTLGGQIYFVPLSVEAAKGLLILISNWRPIQDYLSGQGSPDGSAH